ncbi:hypothetical protein CXG81DRAFT_27013 [Caulochytrium protostelioides]|uniref:Uncharacterized protein n=1 Tax=Caulochytrium protostelioides TaxID=1555241 RepID=A0A4P9X5F6_9FUNG|nr:hypothetical protein CXG81DRAFT_27013 [Caulochytrium protostelioides]|eukprot:RKP00291.1 hypothetical protein CXG81DRAFT_27013 [Caulochytrium protostelioides]
MMDDDGSRPATRPAPPSPLPASSGSAAAYAPSTCGPGGRSGGSPTTSQATVAWQTTLLTLTDALQQLVTHHPRHRPMAAASGGSAFASASAASSSPFMVGSEFEPMGDADAGSPRRGRPQSDGGPPALRPLAYPWPEAPPSMDADMDSAVSLDGMHAAKRSRSPPPPEAAALAAPSPSPPRPADGAAPDCRSIRVAIASLKRLRLAPPSPPPSLVSASLRTAAEPETAPRHRDAWTTGGGPPSALPHSHLRDFRDSIQALDALLARGRALAASSVASSSPSPSSSWTVPTHVADAPAWLAADPPDVNERFAVLLSRVLRLLPLVQMEQAAYERQQHADSDAFDPMRDDLLEHEGLRYASVGHDGVDHRRTRRTGISSSSADEDHAMDSDGPMSVEDGDTLHGRSVPRAPPPRALTRAALVERLTAPEHISRVLDLMQCRHIQDSMQTFLQQTARHALDPLIWPAAAAAAAAAGGGNPADAVHAAGAGGAAGPSGGRDDVVLAALHRRLLALETLSHRLAARMAAWRRWNHYVAPHLFGLVCAWRRSGLPLRAYDPADADAAAGAHEWMPLGAAADAAGGAMTSVPAAVMACFWQIASAAAAASVEALACLWWRPDPPAAASAPPAPALAPPLAWVRHGRQVLEAALTFVDRVAGWTHQPVPLASLQRVVTLWTLYLDAVCHALRLPYARAYAAPTASNAAAASTGAARAPRKANEAEALYTAERALGFVQTLARLLATLSPTLPRPTPSASGAWDRGPLETYLAGTLCPRLTEIGLELCAQAGRGGAHETVWMTLAEGWLQATHQIAHDRIS